MDSIEVLVEDAWTQGKVDGARLTFQFSDAWGKKASRQVITAGDGRGLWDLAGQRVRSAGDCSPRGMFELFDCGNRVECRPLLLGRACRKNTSLRSLLNKPIRIQGTVVNGLTDKHLTAFEAAFSDIRPMMRISLACRSPMGFLRPGFCLR